jgi:protein-tyrosine phosphatase
VPHDRNRHRAIDGTFNFRDTGGLSAGASSTRWGKLFRSDALHQLSDAGRADLAALGIRVVVDLRDEIEQGYAPSALRGVEVQVVRNPIFHGSAASFIAADVSIDTLYREVLTHSGDRLASAIRVIADSGGDPVLVHCTAGKDRTGLVVALALIVSGVDRDEVVDDYAATESYLPRELIEPIIARLRRENVPESTTIDELVGGSPARALNGALDFLVTEFGSVEQYLLAHGLTSAELDRLRAALVE